MSVIRTWAPKTLDRHSCPPQAGQAWSMAGRKEQVACRSLLKNHTHGQKSHPRSKITPTVKNQAQHTHGQKSHPRSAFWCLPKHV